MLRGGGILFCVCVFLVFFGVFFCVERWRKRGRERERVKEQLGAAAHFIAFGWVGGESCRM